MKILIINDTSSSPNWGARATSYALKKMISDTGNHRIGYITEDEIRGNKRPDNVVNKSKDIVKLLAPPILLQLKQKLSSNKGSKHFSRYQHIPQSWEDFDPVARSMLEKKSYLSDKIDHIKKADLVIIQGEGCIYGNTFHSRILLFLAYLSKKYLNKPTIVTNHTADFSHQELFKIARNVYPLLDDIVFREPMSAKRSKGFISARVGADAAFIFRPKKLEDWLPVAKRDTYFDFWPDTAHFDPAKPYICIGGGSGLPSVNDGRYNPVESLSILISYLQDKFPHQLILTASGSTDLKIFRTLEEKFDLPLLGLTIPFQQAVDVLGNAAAYIGGRWHPSIFALSGGTPIIPFSANSFKMEALSKMFQLSDETFDPSNLKNDKKKIAGLLNGYFSEGENLREKLKSRAREEVKRVGENVAYISKMKVLL